jgi:predicted RNase H-like HicB family nuclease
MDSGGIIGYLFTIIVEPGDKWGYIARCPGVGGVYEEAKTAKEAANLAADAAAAIFEARELTGHRITKNGKYLKILRTVINSQHTKPNLIKIGPNQKVYNSIYWITA